MANKQGASSGWATYEIIHRDDAGAFSQMPFTEELTASGKAPVQAIQKMRMLQELGLKEAQAALKDKNGKKLVVKKDGRIWLLKCKPSCWRLYFYADENVKQIVYVYAVCKKQNKEDPADEKKAQRVADRIRPGGSGITAFQFPAG